MIHLKSKLILIVFLFLSCAMYASSKNDTVPYTLAKNYFVKNTYPDKEFHLLKITSEEKLNEIFGMAAFMGKNGKPTKIDFSQQFVIALINSTSNNISALNVYALKNETNGLRLFYSLSTTSAPQSYSARYCALLVVDKKYDVNIITNRVSSNGAPLMGGDKDEFGCKPSTGYTWSVLKKRCISIAQEKGHFLSGTIGNLAFVFGDDENELELFGFQYAGYAKNYVLKNIPGTKEWKNESISLSLENGQYILRDSNKELAKSVK